MRQVIKMNPGFTLLELLMVIMIVGILTAVALPQFSKTKEHTLGKEAIASLKLIAAAQKIYHMENNAYYPNPATNESDAADINSYLKLALPSTETNWDYWVLDSGDPPDAFDAYAQRQGSATYSDCRYTINEAAEDPIVDAGTCP